MVPFTGYNSTMTLGSNTTGLNGYFEFMPNASVSDSEVEMTVMVRSGAGITAVPIISINSAYKTFVKQHKPVKSYLTSWDSYCSEYSASLKVKWKTRNCYGDDTYWQWSWPDCKQNSANLVVPKPPSERLVELIQQRQAPQIVLPDSKRPLGHTEDMKEMCARETLRRILGEDGYQSFLSRGFISVRGKSGRCYQIFPGHGITNVYEMGRMVERLCVVLRGNFPPTDSIIMRYLVILHDEETFRKFAIKHSIFEPSHRRVKEVDQRPLTEIFRELKAAA